MFVTVYGQRQPIQGLQSSIHQSRPAAKSFENSKKPIGERNLMWAGTGPANESKEPMSPYEALCFCLTLMRVSPLLSPSATFWPHTVIFYLLSTTILRLWNPVLEQLLSGTCCCNDVATRPTTNLFTEHLKSALIFAPCSPGFSRTTFCRHLLAFWVVDGLILPALSSWKLLGFQWSRRCF